MNAREIEVGLLGNYDVKSTLPGEVVKDVAKKLGAKVPKSTNLIEIEELVIRKALEKILQDKTSSTSLEQLCIQHGVEFDHYILEKLKQQGDISALAYSILCYAGPTYRCIDVWVRNRARRYLGHDGSNHNHCGPIHYVVKPSDCSTVCYLADIRFKRPSISRNHPGSNLHRSYPPRMV